MLHGTTIATDAVPKHEGVTTGPFTAENYRDVTHIGRHQRPRNYLIQRDITRQDRPLVEEPEADGVEATAVRFPFSSLDDGHERRAKEVVEESYPRRT